MAKNKEKKMEDEEKKKESPFNIRAAIKKRMDSAEASGNFDKSTQHNPEDIQKQSGFKKY